MSESQDVVYGVMGEESHNYTQDESNQVEHEDSLWSFWRTFVISNLVVSVLVSFSMMINITSYRIACTFHMLFFIVYFVYLYKNILQEHLAKMELDRQRMIRLKSASMV